MRLLYSLTLFICFSLSSASAAMFGDFGVPGSLNPRVHGAPGHNNRTAVLVALPSGGDLVLYFPQSGESAPQGETLYTISQLLDQSREVVAFNLGGRPWFGTRQFMADGIVFYNGYTHRNGIVYPVAFSMNTMVSPNAEVKRILSRVFLMPGIYYSPAADLVVDAADQFETGSFDNAEFTLSQAEYQDPGNWAIPYFRGRLEEARENLPAAMAHYQRAHSLFPQDVELAARSLASNGMENPDGAALNGLYGLGGVHPDEAVIWEELGRIYLLTGDMDAARDYFEETVAVNPASEVALYNLAFMTAQDGDYEQALRYSREFMHYRPWLPTGIVPDVTGAPGLGVARVREILEEPLPLGYMGEFAGIQAMEPSDAEVAEVASVIYVQQPTQVYSPTYIYETTNVYHTTYVPLITYAWSWSPRYHRPHGSWHYDRDYRPSWQRPRPPSSSRPPAPRPPSKPGGNRPSRPQRPGGNRPGQGSQRPEPGRPGTGGPERPEGNRPGQGSQRPEPGRPGTGGPERPEGNRPGQGSQRPEPGRPGTGRPERPEGNRPGQPGDDRPTPPSQPRPPVTTLPGTIITQPSRPEQPGTRPSTPTRPETRPTTPARPETRPSTPTRPETRPTTPTRPETRPSTPTRPETGSVTRPAPSQPPATSRPTQPTQPSRPTTPRPETRPAQPQPQPSTPATRPTRPATPRPEARPAQPAQPAPEARPSRPASPGPRPPAANAPNDRPSRPSRQSSVSGQSRQTRAAQPAAESRSAPQPRVAAQPRAAEVKKSAPVRQAQAKGKAVQAKTMQEEVKASEARNQGRSRGKR